MIEATSPADLSDADLTPLQRIVRRQRAIAARLERLPPSIPPLDDPTRNAAQRAAINRDRGALQAEFDTLEVERQRLEYGAPWRDPILGAPNAAQRGGETAAHLGQRLRDQARGLAARWPG